MSTSSLFHPTGGVLVVEFIIDFAAAVLGILLAEHVRRLRGRPVWGMPAFVWAILWFISPLIGGLLFWIATATSRNKSRPGSMYGGPGWG